MPNDDAHDAVFDAAVTEWLQQATLHRARQECIQCGTKITAKIQVGRCIYVEPCGCRLGQGRLLNADGQRVQRLDLEPQEEVPYAPHP
jgi:hypothetical protein